MPPQKFGVRSVAQARASTNSGAVRRSNFQTLDWAPCRPAILKNAAIASA